MKELNIEYRFRFPDQRESRYELTFDARTLKLNKTPPLAYPEWMRLEFHQCDICPLSKKEVQYCPLAMNLQELIFDCDDLCSYDEIEVEVVTEQRHYWKKTTAQKAIGSLMGLIAATSGCPMTVFLRPMARFHLPFATEEETMFRTISTYLLSQYFRRQKEDAIDTSFNGLKQQYHDLQRLNQAFARRLKSATQEDSSVNALVLLDMYAKAAPAMIEQCLDELSYIYEFYP